MLAPPSRSNELARATALALPLSVFRGWNLLPHYARCRAMRQIRVDQPAEQKGDGTLLRDVLPRLRCQRCGDSPWAVKLSDGGGPAGREVWVLGAAM
jgi:hypothetical protein